MKNAWYENIWEVLRSPGFWFFFPVLQLFNKYQRTTLGPLWLVIPTGLFVVLLGSLYSVVMDTNLRPFMIHLSVGYVVWGFMTTSLVSGSGAIDTNKNYALQGNITMAHLIMKTVSQNVITTLHSAVIIPVLLIYFQFFDINILALLVGIIFLLFNSIVFGVIFALIGARFKDMTHIIQSVMRILFFATPIIWLPTSLRGEMIGALLDWNPFYYYLEVIRRPFFGEWAEPKSYIVVGVLSFVAFIVSDVLYRKLSKIYLLWV